MIRTIKIGEHCLVQGEYLGKIFGYHSVELDGVAYFGKLVEPEKEADDMSPVSERDYEC